MQRAGDSGRRDGWAGRGGAAGLIACREEKGERDESWAGRVLEGAETKPYVHPPARFQRWGSEFSLRIPLPWSG